MKAYSVSELSTILKTCFENPAFSHIPVYGEVYSIKLGKFSYIDLGDQGNKQTNSPLLRCAFSCFYGNDYGLEEIKVGDVIMITGSLSYYPHGSSVTLWGNKVEVLKTQEGKNLLLKKKTLEKLEKLGYLDEKRKRKIPSYCKKVAILTAENGAAYQDILKTLHDRFPVSTVLYPVTVQGDGAAKSIVSAMMKCQNHDYDVILLGRGGGSTTDLSCFDDEKVALAIAESKIPVITCIGHTIDTAIADRVSDVKAITPTEGASLINPSMEEVTEYIEAFLEQLDRSYLALLKGYALGLETYREKLNAYSPVNRVKNEKEKVRHYSQQLDMLLKNKLHQEKNFLDEKRLKLNRLLSVLVQNKNIQRNTFLSRLEKYNPEFIAQKGYAFVYQKGIRVKNANELLAGEDVEISFVDGKVKATIKEN